MWIVDRARATEINNDLPKLFSCILKGILFREIKKYETFFLIRLSVTQ